MCLSKPEDVKYKFVIFLVHALDFPFSRVTCPSQSNYFYTKGFNVVNTHQPNSIPIYSLKAKNICTHNATMKKCKLQSKVIEWGSATGRGKEPNKLKFLDEILKPPHYDFRSIWLTCLLFVSVLTKLFSVRLIGGLKV